MSELQIYVSNHPTIPWFKLYSFGPNASGLREKIRLIPGVSYDREQRLYVVPIEIHELLKKGELKNGTTI